jgi:endonuclease/exonuclease/phosphatase family metal-dependent hydrolase
MTLNLAHGRGESAHQLLLDREEIVERLDRVAAVIRREAPDVVALQEADGASFWSGNFDHVAYLARASGLEHYFTGIHADGPRFGYGTALMARTPLIDPTSVPFPPSFPTFTKGYVRAGVAWPGDTDGALVEVVSVHLDFSRRSVRSAQTDQLIADLSGLGRPLVLTGDLNAEWNETSSPVAALVRGLDLRAFEPEVLKITYPERKTRLDWILVSPELTFRDHGVIVDALSDHRAVLATLGPTAPGGPAPAD